MSRNGSGTYTLPSGNPVVSGTLIEATWANTTLSDLASAMTDSLSRSGQGGMTAALRLFDGTSSVPGLAWGSETTTGWYRAGAGDMRLVITGSQVIQYLSTGVAVTGTLSVSGNTTVGGTLGVTGASTFTGAATFNGGISGSPVINAGTANGVAYLNGSKVLTTGSALTFDGSANFSFTGSGLYPVISVAPTGNNAIFGFRMDASAGNGVDWRVEQGRSAVGDFNISAPGVNAAPQYAILKNLSAQYWSIGGSGEQMRLTSTGLGIGTSSPGTKLHVFGDGNVYSQVQASGSGNVGYRLRNTVRDWYLLTNSTGRFEIYDDTAAATRVAIDTSGNLGLGTTSPDARLTIASAGRGRWYRSDNTRFGDIFMDADGFNVVAQSAGDNLTLASTNVITFRTASSERARISSSGGFFVGTTSGSAGFNLNSSSVPWFNMTASATSASYGAFYKGGTSTAVGYIGTDGGGIAGGGSGDNFGIRAESALLFMAGASERARIDSSGNLLVGKTSTSSTATGVITYGSGSADHGLISIARGPNATMIQFFNASTGNVVGQISQNGSNTTYSTSSDYRLKEDIAPMTGALSVVQQLKPCTYKWKADGSDGQGFIAHELQAIVPDAVVGEKDAVDAEGNPQYQGIDTSFLVATLTAAIQEQQAIINQLKADVAALKGA